MPEVGPAGRNLIANVDRLRQERGLSWRKLSAELDAIGRPIPPLGFTRMTRGERPDGRRRPGRAGPCPGCVPCRPAGPPDGASAPDHAALRAAAELADRIAGLLRAAKDPASAGVVAGSVDRALRGVQLEVEELLAEVPAKPRIRGPIDRRHTKPPQSPPTRRRPP